MNRLTFSVDSETLESVHLLLLSSSIKFRQPFRSKSGESVQAPGSLEMQQGRVRNRAVLPREDQQVD